MSARDKDLAIVTTHLEQLSEHFESVQIFCNRHEHGELDGTVQVQKGSGNWFARYGQVKQWVVEQEEYERMKARANES